MSKTWWGDFAFEVDQARHWCLGPFEARILRMRSEYRLDHVRDIEEERQRFSIGQESAEEEGVDAELIRFGVRNDADRLLIAPATADRAVVVKSESPFIVPPGGATTAFVSSPLWFQVYLPDPRRLLWEQPMLRPSDTWFGPSTIEGELCYALRTSVRYSLENLKPRPYRAVSVVHILNHADTPLSLERVRLPMSHQCLYADAEGRLWTESVTLDRSGDDDLAAIKLGKSAPREAGPCKKVAGPREELAKKDLIRSFTTLLGLNKGRLSIERVVE